MTSTISGRFSATHSNRPTYVPDHPPVPVLNAAIWVPDVATNVSVNLEFLVDTGADMTVLHPQDSLRMLTTPEQWNTIHAIRPTHFGGAGRGLPYYPIRAYLFLSCDDGTIDSNEFMLYVAEPVPELAGTESLLGRDILGRYSLTFAQFSSLSLVR